MAAILRTYGTFPRCEWSDRRRAYTFFLLVIGLKTYKLLCSLVSPNKPGDRSFAELVQVLKSQYNPEQSEIQALQISHSIQKTRGVCLRATDSGTDMQLWRFLGRYAQRPTGLWDK